MKQVIFKILDYYKKLSDPIKASFWFTISSVIQKGIALLSTPIFTRLLTTEEYGVYSVYQSWYSIIAIFATLNLYAGVYNNGMTKWPDKRFQFTSSLLGLSSVCTITVFVFYSLTNNFWNSILGLSDFFVVLIFIQALFEPAYNFWAASERYDYRYKKLVMVSVLIGISSPIIGVLAVCFSAYKAEARVLSHVIIQVCIGALMYLLQILRGKRFYTSEYWKFALKFNIPLIPHYLSQTVLNQADRIMISHMVGSGEAAIYSVAYSISMMFTIVTNAINNTFIPYTYKSIRDKKYNQLRKNASFLVLAVGLACVIVMTFGPEIIKIFAAPEYYDARWIVPPVAEALLFMFIFPLFCNVEFYFAQTKFIMVASSVAALTNVCLNYIGIRLFGYIAAAYTTLICYILLSIAHYAAYRRICKKEGILVEIYNIKIILITSFSSLLLMIFITLFYDYIVVRYFFIVVVSFLCVTKRESILGNMKEISGR